MRIKKYFMKILLVCLLIVVSVILNGCKKSIKIYRDQVKTNVSEVVLEEYKLAFKFFWETTNTDETSTGYGLIPDRYHVESNSAGSVASIASVGFGLTAIPIGIENDWITYQEGEARAYQTLITISQMARVHGFWYHFVDMKTAKRVWNCELSIIDSAILISGALIVGQYFGGRIENLARKLYREIEWSWYYNPEVNKFYMGYSPEKGFEGYWNGYAEQLMIFVLAAGSPNYPVGVSAYNLMKISSKKEQSTPHYGSFYSTYTGSLFTHQFSHAWIDFNRYLDDEGYNWFTNSVHAVEAAIQFAISLKDKYSGLHENSWGMSACDGPGGYVGPYGSGPSEGNAHRVDGTVPAYGALGSIVFKPKEAISAIENYRTYEKFWSKYGFKDSYNLSYSTNGWFASDIIGIDKGIGLLMIENYLSNFIWNIFDEIDYVQNGLENLNFKKVERDV